MGLRLCALLVAFSLYGFASAYAGGECDVFVRMLEKLTAAESSSATRYLLRNSAEIQAFSRDILGATAAGLNNQELGEAAIKRLQKEGSVEIAEALESRLNGIEKDFASALARDPKAEPKALLKKFAAERLRSLDTSPLTEGESAVSKALGVTHDSGALRTRVLEAAASSPELKIGKALKNYERLLKDLPNFERYFPNTLVYQQLADEELVSHTSVMTEVFGYIDEASASTSMPRKIQSALRKALKGKVPASTIPARIQAFMAGETGSLARAMGDMTLEEVQLLVHGGNPLRPTAESLLGRYLSETGATTAVRTFEDAAAAEAGKQGARGPRKLVVSVSANSLAAFERLFNRKEWMSVFNHAYVVHDGQVTTYSQELSDFRLPGTEYTPFPMVLLKTTEADRLAQYLKLFRREEMLSNGWDSKATAPWRNKGYCATSAWAGNCTQHIGNMPIGDQRVIEYTMPGEKTTRRDPLNPIPEVEPLHPFSKGDALLKRVWKTPGNMQFAEVLGQQGANLRGEFANPGWLISTLLGPTSVERVPIVFVVRPDHTLPIGARIDLHVEGRI